MTEKKKFKFSFVLDQSLCMACAACELECREGGIYIDDSVNYNINPNNCNRCGRCFRACPTGAISRVNNPA
ncbi:4Fe-4S binding protein [Desulfallas sp. Bu1-1]|uniref:4Fe-4S binding protein n=1 Tax=Desulfallas sp. Bu1-1 TaxID=2787620 RepID=UPI00189F0FEA|nr:4Fe-4S binding protein [Desulfallas sp. Bu1-1]MBF7084550.1 4Fe-4S binding protein [Desulfallas sp. Bu1-1]